MAVDLLHQPAVGVIALIIIAARLRLPVHRSHRRADIAGGVTVTLFAAGAGLGFFVQVSVLAGQNAVDYSMLGVATGALNFFKTMGGAFGAALFGATLAAGLAGRPASAQTYLHGFQTVFFWTSRSWRSPSSSPSSCARSRCPSTCSTSWAGQAEVPEY